MAVIDTEFDAIVANEIAHLERTFPGAFDNIAVTIEQDARDGEGGIRLRRGETLLGLYEGVPRLERTYDEAWMLPDKITLFMGPICEEAEADGRPLDEVVRDVVWHEVAHALGLGERRARAAEKRRRSDGGRIGRSATRA